jgi:NAD(P)-dependent dehydrogenase (short-subunit alcohol dehydrogenase family)
MLLEKRNAIIYGAGGGIGGVGRTFAREGAGVFLASDRAGGKTATFVNITAGMVQD